MQQWLHPQYPGSTKLSAFQAVLIEPAHALLVR
jgi:hypothetical protein